MGFFNYRFQPQIWSRWMVITLFQDLVCGLRFYGYFYGKLKLLKALSLHAISMGKTPTFQATSPLTSQVAHRMIGYPERLGEITPNKKKLQPFQEAIFGGWDDHPKWKFPVELTMSVFHGTYPEPFVVLWLILRVLPWLFHLPQSPIVDGRLRGWILGSNMSKSKTRGIIRFDGSEIRLTSCGW